ncbi:TPA: hypothetical protein ACGO3D_000547 [Streptococcus suis]
MKVSELANITNKETYFRVSQNGAFLEGDYPVYFLDCELEIKEVTVGNCETLFVEVLP